MRSWELKGQQTFPSVKPPSEITNVLELSNLVKLQPTQKNYLHLLKKVLNNQLFLWNPPLPSNHLLLNNLLQQLSLMMPSNHLLLTL